MPLPARYALASLALLAPALLVGQINDQPADYLFHVEDQLEDYYVDFIEETDAKEIFEFTDEHGLLIHGREKSEGYLQTLDEFDSYELEFDWRWPDEAEPGKGGIIVHSSTYPYMGIWPEGIIIDLDHENVGDFWLYGAELEVPEEQVPTRSAERHRRTKLEDAEKEPGHWNQMKIAVTKDAVKVYLNDELVNEGKSPSLSAGYLTFQSEGSDIEFREVRLRKLEAK